MTADMDELTPEEIEHAKKQREQRKIEQERKEQNQKLLIVRVSVAGNIATGLVDNPGMTNEAVALRALQVADEIIRLAQGDKPREAVAKSGDTIDPGRSR